MIYTVIFAQTAKNDFYAITDFIKEKGYPDTATKYGNRLIDFCEQLSIMPEKHLLCRKYFYRQYGYRCVVFEKTYVVVYRIESDKVVIKRIINGKLLQ